MTIGLRVYTDGRCGCRHRRWARAEGYMFVLVQGPCPPPVPTATGSHLPKPHGSCQECEMNASHLPRATDSVSA